MLHQKSFSVMWEHLQCCLLNLVLYVLLVLVLVLTFWSCFHHCSFTGLREQLFPLLHHITTSRGDESVIGKRWLNKRSFKLRPPENEARDGDVGLTAAAAANTSVGPRIYWTNCRRHNRSFNPHKRFYFYNNSNNNYRPIRKKKTI